MLNELQHSALGQLAGRAIIVAVFVLMLFNAAVMIISPSMWFRLPSWLRAQGTLTREKYSSGAGALRLRLLGVIVIASIAWVVRGFLAGPTRL
jgi:hypothetical protein